MGINKNAVGSRYGRLVITSRAGSVNKHSTWNCVCDCGSQKVVSYGDLNKGHTKSCGCIHIERTSKMNYRDGLKKTPEYAVWGAIIQRCKNENSRNFHRYGGRGICVSDEFLDSSVFINYIKSLPKYEDRVALNLSLDRVNNEGNYERGNLRWATKKEQANNTWRSKKYKEIYKRK